MIVVHGLWRIPGRLALWAEDSATPPTGAPVNSQSSVSGRGTNSPHHPFACAPDVIVDSLSDTAAGFDRSAHTLRYLDVTLPTVRESDTTPRPADAPELVRHDLTESRVGRMSDAPWRVPAVEFDEAAAYPMLAAIAASQAADQETIVIDAALRHLCRFAEFADDLVRRGRLLPTISDDDVPCWRPVLIGPDATWARALTLALPPSARATWPESPQAATVAADALDTLVDGCARAVLATAAPSAIRRPSGDLWQNWLAGLTGAPGRLDPSRGDIASLRDALTSWHRDAAANRVRACFRLIEPDVDDGQSAGEPIDADVWSVQFALQAADEPSLVVDAERLWRSRGGRKNLAAYLDDPQETLLAELGRASRLYPALDAALRTATPSELTLDSRGAHEFLTEGAPLLAGAGFGVLLPSWWSRPRSQLGAKLRASWGKAAPGTVTGTSAVGMDAVVDYEWQLALGDDVLSEGELRALSELSSPLVRLRGQWVELDAKRLADALTMMDGGRMRVLDLLHAGLSAQDGPGGLPVVSVQADGALGDLLSGEVEHRLSPRSAPDGFTGTLRPYQERGLSWLAFLETLGLGPLLADDMGLGKSATVLALVASDPPGHDPTLLVCPMSLVGNWQREVAKFAPGLKVHVHHGAERARGSRFEAAVAKANLVITTYALADRDCAQLAALRWHRLVIDEAQAIKNSTTRQAVAVRSLPATHRLAITGTPVENRLADLWSIMEFTNPGLLGPAVTFKKRYAEPIERRGDETAATRLKRLTGPFVLRRVKTDKSIISDLPEKLEMEVLCNLTKEQAALYQAVVSDMLAKIEASDGIGRRGLVLATMTKLKQVCNHPAHFLRDGTRLAGRSGKLARLDEILDEVLAAGEKALLFTQYAEFGSMLRAHLSARFGREVAFLHGGVSKADRDAMVSRFSEEGPHTPALFVLSLKAGGTGLTLTAANHVIHVDRWWNPAVEDQATDRAFRIGQTRNVQVRKFVCVGTVEEKISEMIREKRGLAAKIVGTGEQWLTELSTAQLRELLTLEKGAVVE